MSKIDAFYKTRRVEVTGTPLRVAYVKQATTRADVHRLAWAAMRQYLSPDSAFLETAADKPYSLMTCNM